MQINVEENQIRLEDNTIRYVIRKRRIEELKKTMDDLTDHTISKGSISNIEKAKGNISPKTLEIYLNKLDLDEDRVLELAKEAEAEMEEIYQQLEAIETIIDNEDDHLGAAKELLSKMEFEDYHPLTPFISYLQGLIFYEEKEWEKAEKMFKYAIKLCKEKYNHKPKDNIIAACYCEIAKCYYVQHDIDQALVYVNLGLSEYDESKERKGVKYKLLGNKVLYLLKTSQNDEASRLLYNVWPEVAKLDHSYDDYPILNIYKFRSIFLRNQKRYDDAIKCCDMGLKIARSRWKNRKTPYLDFLIIFGSIYLQLQEYEKAFDRFQLALYSDKKQKAPRRHVEAHTYLGIFFIAKKDWHQATHHLEEALRIGRENPDAFRMTKALTVRGNVHYFQNQFSEALPYYKEAAELAEKYGYKQRKYTALLKTADCFDKMNDKKQFRNYCEKLYYLQKELNIKSEDEIYEIAPLDRATR
ncbi:Tetratricopeptide repeat-containing protein [Laceyella tengchongensis]|uniref:Tetratricopeptide repeat-containing protein n=1 Tax=Laceyella tengchongensis TaxID=574699 RepID=A0AA45WRT1_9BACL|nr:helix-turn-helix transcriptional regulator [Laceyella tengchongensis]SMP32847.1 Tetratricopeptide repeat-containing protein [Laceyella tengchongensis]